jgi:5-methyltetrahydropteroyltriglutamate--homocysteine methyltransferase
LITPEQLRSIEDNHILEAVKKQEEIGLKGITDGEYRRDYWHLDFMWSFDGVIPSDDIYTNRFHGVEFSARAAEISDRVSYPKNGIMLDHFKFLTKSVKETAKFTIPSAAQFRHREGVRLANTNAYTDLDEFWDDIGKSYNRAVLAFADLGCKYIQIDDVNSALLCDPKIRAGFEKYGGDPSQMLDVNIEVNNAALANRPDDMRATIHLCRGNFQSTYAGRGGYEPIAEKYLVKMNVNGFFLEFDDD